MSELNLQQELHDLKCEIKALKCVVEHLSNTIKRLNMGDVTYGGMEVDPSYWVNLQLWDKSGLPKTKEDE